MLSAVCGSTPVASLPQRSPSFDNFAERESEPLAVFIMGGDISSALLIG